ncbi:MAG: N-acetylmuramidase domain-containing protein [Aequorivita sp.]
MIALIHDPQIQQIINPPNASPYWESDLKRFENGDVSLDRHTAGENTIRAFQRLLIFLGYSTSSSGAFAIDGDFGRGTNRALAQFEYEHQLSKPNFSAKSLTYECNWRSARANIAAIPDVLLTLPTLVKMLEAAKDAIAKKEINCGDFNEAIFQLNALYNRNSLDCRKINERYGASAEKASQNMKDLKGYIVQLEWILAIIRQESAGVVRPRFEQHKLSKFAKEEPQTDFAELRYRSMSFGLGQIMGFNYNSIGAQSAKELYTAPLEKQITSIARFLTIRSSVRNVVSKTNPTAEDFKVVASYYNGSGYAGHYYDESLGRWFKEFRILRG